jgi:hypothetical protein
MHGANKIGRKFRMIKAAGSNGSGAGRHSNHDATTNHLCRPAPLPPDFERLVIPNHFTEVAGRSGEGSHSRKEPDIYLSLAGGRLVPEAIGEEGKLSLSILIHYADS